MAGTLYPVFLIQGVVVAGGTTTHTVVRPLVIIDAGVLATATNGGATVKVTTATGDVTEAMVCATDTNVVRAGVVLATTNSAATGSTLSFVGGNGADGIATAHVILPASAIPLP
tara:strand:- start:545 stop:886 length:342 start_codon:yes stop_codon:yes gene_type:complete